MNTAANIANTVQDCLARASNANDPDWRLNDGVCNDCREEVNQEFFAPMPRKPELHELEKEITRHLLEVDYLDRVADVSMAQFEIDAHKVIDEFIKESGSDITNDSLNFAKSKLNIDSMWRECNKGIKDPSYRI